MIRVWLAACAVAICLAVPASAHAQVAGLEFIGPEKVAVALDGDKGTATKSVWVRNTTSEANAVTPTFETLLEDGDGDAVTLNAMIIAPIGTDAELAAGEAKRYRVKFADAENFDSGASGELVVKGAGAPGTVNLSVSEKTVVNAGVTEALLIPLGLAIAKRGVPRRPFSAMERKKWFGPLPSGIEFDKSFASGITAVGAILGTILTASVLPEETTSLSKEAYAALNLIFGIAVVVAAFVYAAMQLPAWGPVKDEPKREQMELKGSPVGYLVAATITVWAALGELWLTTRLLGELGSGKGFSRGAMIVLGVLLLVALVLLGLYVYRRLLVVFTDERDIKKPDPDKPDPKTKRRQHRSVAAGGPPAPQPQSVPLL